MTTVTQADREAAWPYAPGCYAAEDKDGWMRGTYDKFVPIIQAFAAHREAAFGAGAKAMQEAAAQVALDYLSGDGFDSRDCDVVLAVLIRALDPEQESTP